MTHQSQLRNQLVRISTVLPLAFTLPAADKPSMAASPPGAQPGAWSTSASLAVKESYDDNVFLQSVTPAANRGSMITTILPVVGAAYKPSPLFNASLSYAPEINFFHSESSEDYTLHRTGLALGGKAENTCWDMANSLVLIDGSHTGPTFLGVGGAPAAGGPGIRDRRDALVERGQVRLAQTFGQWFVRPVVSGYFHDFKTDQKTTAGYQNYVDRNDFNAGADLGYAITKAAWLFGGYRYGLQNQAQLFSSINPTHYDNTYHRLLFGAEGKAFDWLKLSVSAGPEFRHYDGIVAAGFDRHELYAYVDTTITVTPTKADTVVLTARRFEQPGFSGRSTYIDSTYELSWRHKLTDKLTLGAGMRGYNTDFLKPSATRNDWIITGNVVAAYAFNQRFSVETSYSYDDAERLISDTPGREYTRNLVSLGLRYVFK